MFRINTQVLFGSSILDQQKFPFPLSVALMMFLFTVYLVLCVHMEWEKEYSSLNFYSE